MENGEEVGAFTQNISFNESDADPEALKMNHYTREAWADAVSPAVCAARFAAWLRPFQSVTLTSKRTGQPYTVARLAGYNAVSFDLPRLKEMFGASFFPCEYLVRDVLQRALFYFDEHPHGPQPENFKLATVCAMFGIDTDGAHGALADARMCARLHRVIMEAE
jgi:DNA polymerase III epsilon subunit-like protein